MGYETGGNHEVEWSVAEDRVGDVDIARGTCVMNLRRWAHVATLAPRRRPEMGSSYGADRIKLSRPADEALMNLHLAHPAGAVPDLVGLHVRGGPDSAYSGVCVPRVFICVRQVAPESVHRADWRPAQYSRR